MLVIADLHLGLAGNVKEIGEKAIDIAKKTNCSTILINGDLKHIGLFGVKRAKRFVEELESELEVLIVRGNHDANLKSELDTSKFYSDGSLSVLHGHLEYKEAMDSDVIVLAHSHPAYFIKDVVHGYKERVWLEGELEGRKVVVMPAFNELCSSTAVNLDRPAGFIFKKVNKFSVFTLDGVYLGEVVV